MIILLSSPGPRALVHHEIDNRSRRQQPRNRNQRDNRNRNRRVTFSTSPPRDRQPTESLQASITTTENEFNLQRICPVVVYYREVNITPDDFNILKARHGEFLILQGPSGSTVSAQDYRELYQRFGASFTLNLR